LDPEKSIPGSKIILSSTNVSNIDNNGVSNQYMISEESRDNEDWSNETENSALHHRNK